MDPSTNSSQEWCFFTLWSQSDGHLLKEFSGLKAAVQEYDPLIIALRACEIILFSHLFVRSFIHSKI